MVKGMASVGSASEENGNAFCNRYFFQEDSIDCSVEQQSEARVSVRGGTNTEGSVGSENANITLGDDTSSTTDKPANLDVFIEMKENRPKKRGRFSHRMTRRSEEERASIGLLPLIDAAIELEQGLSESSRGTGGIVSSVAKENISKIDPSKLKRKNIQENDEVILKGEESRFLLDSAESNIFKTFGDSSGTKEEEDATEPDGMKPKKTGEPKQAGYKRDKGGFLLTSVLNNSAKANNKKSKGSNQRTETKILKVKIIENGEVRNTSDQNRLAIDLVSSENPKTSSESCAKNHQQFPCKDFTAKPWALTWEAINSDCFADIPSITPTTLPPKSRHADSIYSRWCSTILNALLRSARCFASHEFFYSDIDRGW
jgi:hypothetical protein